MNTAARPDATAGATTQATADATTQATADATTQATADATVPVTVHVSGRGNGFMTDIAHWLTDAAQRAGWRSQLAVDDLPRADGGLHLVVAPHEFFFLHPDPNAARALPHSILIGTEQPGTVWFERSAAYGASARAMADINPLATAALRARGIAATHLRLGAVPAMVHPAADTPTGPTDAPTREIDVMFLGGLDARRGRALAALAPYLATHHSEIRLVLNDRPLQPGDPGVVLGGEKYARLAATRVLINLHRERASADEELPAYLEWVRLIEAMANGAVVLTEPVADYGPLVPGEHCVVATIEEMPAALAALLADEPARVAMAQRARHLVTHTLDLPGQIHAALTAWAALPEGAVSAPRSVRGVGAGLARPRRGLSRRGLIRRGMVRRDMIRRDMIRRGLIRRDMIRRARVRPSDLRLPGGFGLFQPFEDLRARAKSLALAEQRTLRRLDQVAALLTHGDADHCEIWPSPGHDPEAAPVVSVVITLYNYAAVVAETIESVAACRDIAFELIVIDDHSRDESVTEAKAALARHPHLDARLVARSVNGGLAAARNLGVQMARGRLVMILDADNHVYPRTLAALADCLDRHPEAAAAWSILEDFGASSGLRSAVAWDVGRLCHANYLDAQSMWRRAALIDLGGYRDDDDLVYGWEDWDLWLRLAASGGHGVLHPEILGRYRVQEVSMIALTNLARAQSIQALRDRYPSLPWPADIAL